jgi:hypothetical protein
MKWKLFKKELKLRYFCLSFFLFIS